MVQCAMYFETDHISAADTVWLDRTAIEILLPLLNFLKLSFFRNWPKTRFTTRLLLHNIQSININKSHLLEEYVSCHMQASIWLHIFTQSNALFKTILTHCLYACRYLALLKWPFINAICKKRCWPHRLWESFWKNVCLKTIKCRKISTDCPFYELENIG